MVVLVTGSAGHLGEGLMRSLLARGHQARGLDQLPSPYTDTVGSITDRKLVRNALEGVDAVAHTATLHKPHVATHSRQQFLETNLSGTLRLLEEAARSSVKSFVFTSTTSAFGRSLTPPEADPAAWITEEVTGLPKNIYGVTKTAAEDLCWLVHQDSGLPCLVLRTSRFFPEPDDTRDLREAYQDANLKANEFLYRRVDLDDAVGAHMLALERAPEIGFGKYIVSATTPFRREHLAELRRDAPSVVRRLFPDYESEYARRGWRMLPAVDRVYVNLRARQELGWTPRYDFARVLASLQAGRDPRSPLAQAVGSKGYHRLAGSKTVLTDAAARTTSTPSPGEHGALPGS